ncbi:hypothetical protein ATM98_04190 [Streptococcus sp. A12]|nr:hypothetical protein ATM98_04190 [Streptococcus sp. A12]
MEILLTLDRMGIEHFIKYSLFDKEQKKNTKNLIGIWIIGLTMKQQIPTPIQRVGYSSLITSNIGIAQQVLDRKIWFIRQNKLTWLHKRGSV